MWLTVCGVLRLVSIVLTVVRRLGALLNGKVVVNRLSRVWLSASVTFGCDLWWVRTLSSLVVMLCMCRVVPCPVCL